MPRSTLVGSPARRARSRARAWKPAYLGQQVIYHYANERGPNGSSMAAAVVTRVWTGDLVNLTVFGDGGETMWCGSVARCNSEHHQPGQAGWTPGGAP